MRSRMISRKAGAASPLARTLTTALVGLSSVAGLSTAGCAQAAPDNSNTQMLEWMQRAHQPAGGTSSATSAASTAPAASITSKGSGSTAGASTSTGTKPASSIRTASPTAATRTATPRPAAPPSTTTGTRKVAVASPAKSTVSTSVQATPALNKPAAGAAPAGTQTAVAIPDARLAKIYQQQCATCHGSERLGAMGPALLPESLERIKPAEVLRVIRQGRPATQMVGYADKLSEAEIQGLARWVQQPPAKPVGWTDAEMRASHREFVKPDYSDKVKPAFKVNDPHNLFVVVEAGDHHVSVIDGDTFTPITRFESHFALHGGPKFTPDGRFVYFASRDGWVSQYDLYTLKKVAEIRVGINTRNVAVSSDGKWVLAGNTLPQNLVLLDAQGLKPVRTYPVKDREGKSSRVSAVYDAAPRNSFVVALKDSPELWSISYDPKAEPFYAGFVHDYKMKEGIPTKGFLNPRVTPLQMVLDDFYFDPDYKYVMGASRDGKAQVISLVSRGKVAELPLQGMPHLGSGITFNANGRLYMASTNLNTPTITVIDMQSWKVAKEIPIPGPGFFLRSHEETPYAWVDSMMSPTAKDTISIIDKRTLEVVRQLRLRPGKTNAHVEFTRDGRYALVSIMENPGELIIVDAKTFQEVKALPMSKPIGKYNVFNKVTRSEGTSH